MNFNQEQQAIIEEQSNYVQVIAAAGSGKTSTMIGILDKFIREEKVDLTKVLVLTFSRKAVLEFSHRLKRIHPKHPIRIQTFHAHCLATLKNYHPMFASSPPSIFKDEEKIQFFKEFFQKHRFRVGGIPYKLLLDQNLYYLKLLFPELHQDVLLELETFKKKQGKLEFDDLVSMYLAGLFKKEEWTQNPRSNIQRMIVDEFQDTNEEQLNFLKLLNPEYLTVVGDDWQAIYGFRGATPKPFLDFQESFVPTVQHFLATNYRSLPAIVDISQKPILENSNYIPKKVKASREGNAHLEIWRTTSERNDTIQLASKIMKFIETNPDSKILCRTNYRKKEFSICGIPDNYLMTVHASKGLEFDSVFVDLISGWNEDSTSLALEILEEERRILYVALSRAKNNIILLGSNLTKKSNRLEDIFLSYFTKGSKKIKKASFL